MNPEVRIEDFSIVSEDGMLTDAAGNMHELVDADKGLTITDWRRSEIRTALGDMHVAQIQNR